MSKQTRVAVLMRLYVIALYETICNSFCLFFANFNLVLLIKMFLIKIEVLRYFAMNNFHEGQ